MIKAYCTMRNGEPHNVHNEHKAFTSGIMCKPDEMVYIISFEECNEESYDMVGYKYNGKINYIFKTLLMLSTCFQYGLKKHIEKNGGRVVYLKIIDVKEYALAKDLKTNVPNLHMRNATEPTSPASPIFETEIKNENRRKKMEEKDRIKEEIQDGELVRTMAHVIKNLVENQSEPCRKEADDILEMMENLPYDFRNPDIFNTMFMFPIEQVFDAIAKGLCGSKSPEVKDSFKPQFVFIQYGFLSANISKLVATRMNSSACSSDVSRTILSMYLRYALTGEIPETDYEEHYWLPKFGENKEWMEFCDGLYKLYYGNPELYLKAYGKLIASTIRRYPHTKYSLYAVMKNGSEVLIGQRYDNDDFSMMLDKSSGFYNLPKAAFPEGTEYESADGVIESRIYYQVPEKDIVDFRTMSESCML